MRESAGGLSTRRGLLPVARKSYLRRRRQTAFDGGASGELPAQAVVTSWLP